MSPVTKVFGMSNHTVKTASSADQLRSDYQKAYAEQHVGATLMNKTSSRSHIIFTITIEMINDTNGSIISQGSIAYIDLAGSERQSKTAATGDRL